MLYDTAVGAVITTLQRVLSAFARRRAKRVLFNHDVSNQPGAMLTVMANRKCEALGCRLSLTYARQRADAVHVV